MIRLIPVGPVNTDLMMDVELTYKSATVLGAWPLAKQRSAGLLWQDLRFAGDKETPRQLPENSWLLEPRLATQRNLVAGATAEGFLYDLELPYAVSLDVKGGEKNVYHVAQHMDAPMLNLTLYKHDGGRSAHRNDRPPRQNRASSSPTTASADATSRPAATPWRDRSAPAIRTTTPATSPTTLAAATAPSTPKPQPLKDATDITLCAIPFRKTPSSIPGVPSSPVPASLPPTRNSF